MHYIGFQIKTLLFVFGTRPEAIKMLPLVNCARNHYKNKLQVKVCVTGQHRQMLDQVLNLFQIMPDYDLDIMREQQDLYDITARVLLSLRPILADLKPDCVLVHGDTTTTISSTLAAYYQKIPVAHIEAGLRSHDLFHPWPEEMNRSVTACIASYHFVPTETSRINLERENISKNVVVVGNTVIDSLLGVVDKFNSNSYLSFKLDKFFNSIGVNFNKKLILVTGHRRENFGVGFTNICKAIKQIANTNPDIQLVYPVHLNPIVKSTVYEALSGLSNVVLIQPLDYHEFVFLMQKSYIILTDSGGIQEEAIVLKKPVLLMRDITERPEAVSEGAVKLVGTNSENIIIAVEKLLYDSGFYQKMTNGMSPYGKGQSSQLILEYLINNL